MYHTYEKNDDTYNFSFFVIPQEERLFLFKNISNGYDFFIFEYKNLTKDQLKNIKVNFINNYGFFSLNDKESIEQPNLNIKYMKFNDDLNKETLLKKYNYYHLTYDNNLFFTLLFIFANILTITVYFYQKRKSNG